MREGRSFTEVDREGRGVAIVKETLALDRPARPEVYQLYAGSIEWPLTMFVAVAAEGSPSALVAPVRRAVQRLDPESPLAAVAAIERLVAESLAPRRFVTGLFALFAALALALASVGIYGTLAQLVAQRRRPVRYRQGRPDPIPAPFTSMPFRISIPPLPSR